MMHIVWVVGVVVVGFVVGVLVGRRNKKKVEAAVAEVHKLTGGKL